MADNHPPWDLISTDSELRRLCRRLSGQSTIAVDTEANALFAYRERLCLLQISTRNADYLIDGLADLDFAPLAPVFADAGVLKVLHAAEYDVLMLKSRFPFEFRGLFDTKVAAASLGAGSLGLAGVLDEWLGVEIDKKHQRSDWGKRPLSDGQLEYATTDTRFLIELSELLLDRLYSAPSPHMEEVAAECRRLEALVPGPRTFHPDEFLRIKGVARLDRLGRRVLRDLNAMRDEIACRGDRPPFKVLSNEMLLEIAASRPTSLSALRHSGALSAKLVTRYGASIVRVVAHAVREGPLRPEPHAPAAPEDQLSGPQRKVYDLLRRWRKRVAEQRPTDPALVLPRTMLLSLARFGGKLRHPSHLLEAGLEPWRVEAYGFGILETLDS